MFNPSTWYIRPHDRPKRLKLNNYNFLFENHVADSSQSFVSRYDTQGCLSLDVDGNHSPASPSAAPAFRIRTDHPRPYRHLFVSTQSFPEVVVSACWKLGAHGASVAYLGHNGLSIFTLDIAEGHLCAFMLVEFELREVKVRHLVKRD